MRSPACTRVSVRGADGVRLRVAEYGSGPLTVLLLHGWTLDRRLWRRQIADLPAHFDGGVRILAMDLRGHGESEGGSLDGTTLSQLADDIAEVLRQCAPDGRVVLAGHSLGGMAILEFAHRHPAEFARRVAGVTLVSTSAEGHAHTSYGLTPWLGRAVRQLEIGGAAVLARSGPWKPHRPFVPALWPAVRWLVFGDRVGVDAMCLTLAMISRASLRSIGGFRPSVSRMDRVAALNTLARVPVAVLVGTRDRLTPPKCTEAITTALPHAELRVLPGCGHMLPLECPDTVTEALAAICRAATTRRRPGRQATRAPRQAAPVQATAA
jgi:pimeloyl-ACP methyl ester carboxylesterase